MANERQRKDAKLLKDDEKCFCSVCRQSKIVDPMSVLEVPNVSGGKFKNAYICRECLTKVKQGHSQQNPKRFALLYNKEDAVGVETDNRFQLRFNVNIKNDRTLAFLMQNSYSIRKIGKGNTYSIVTDWLSKNGLTREVKTLTTIYDRVNNKEFDNHNRDYGSSFETYFNGEEVVYKKFRDIENISMFNIKIYARVDNLKINSKELMNGCKVFCNNVIKLDNVKDILKGAYLLGSYLNFQRGKYYNPLAYRNAYESYLNGKISRAVALQVK